MITELTEYYNPKTIHHRDSQMKIIQDVFSNFKKNGMATNLVLLGVTGSGKTTVIRSIIERQNYNYYASGSITKTSFRTLRAMFDLNCNTNERLITEIISNLKKNPKILIIDEINKISDQHNLFNDLNTIYRETTCPIILVTNRRTLIEDMPDDARLTLFFDKVEFPAYNSLELYSIIEERLNILKGKVPKVPEGTLRRICAIGGKEASARIVLNITLKCILANNFSEKYIDDVLRNLEKEDWKDFVGGLRHTEKEFLRTLLDLQTSQKDISATDIAKCMNNFTPARISQLISVFEDYGIIESKYKNLGRAGGRKRAIKFVSEEIFHNLDEIIN